MDITFACELCGQSIVIDEAAAGQLVDCPKCGTSLEVPYKSKPLDGVAAPSPPPPSSPSRTPTPPMLLQSCPDCKQQISKRASTCLSCGAPIWPVRIRKFRKIAAVTVFVIALGVVAYKGFQVKMIGDKAFDKVGQSSSSWTESCAAGMGMKKDLTNGLYLSTQVAFDALDEQLKRSDWNRAHPYSEQKPKIDFDRLNAAYIKTTQTELERLADRGRETATQGAILAALFLTAALLIRPRKSI